MRSTATPSRALGLSNISSSSPPPSSVSYSAAGQMSRLAGATTPRGTPIQNIPLSSARHVDDEPNLNVSDATPVSHLDAIVPFHFDFSEQLLAAAHASTKNNSAAPMGLAGVHLTKDQLLQLQVETTAYVENLDLSLKTLFSNDNSRLRQTIVNTNEIPSTFLFLRLQQQMLKLSGDYSAQRERATLNSLAQLLDA